MKTRHLSSQLISIRTDARRLLMLDSFILIATYASTSVRVITISERLFEYFRARLKARRVRRVLPESPGWCSLPYSEMRRPERGPTGPLPSSPEESFAPDVARNCPADFGRSVQARKHSLSIEYQKFKGLSSFFRYRSQIRDANTLRIIFLSPFS